jgi:hypothetical protein
MKRFVLVATTCGVLALAGGLFERTWQAGAEPDTSDFLSSNTQFAVNFCYNQYKDQSDIARCLTRNLP